MNLARGLLQGWVFFSVLWIIGGGFLVYMIHEAETVSGTFTSVLEFKAGVDMNSDMLPSDKLFSESMRSPSAEKRRVEFALLRARNAPEPSNSKDLEKIGMPDGSVLYVNLGYSEADRTYIAKQYWDQRWSRWASAAGTVALWTLVPSILLFVVGYGVLRVRPGAGNTASKL
jgi:hypothetical protein